MDANLNAAERALVRTLRAARVLLLDGDEAAAMRMVHNEAVPLMVVCVRWDDDTEIHGKLTMPVIPTNNPEA